MPLRDLLSQTPVARALGRAAGRRPRRAVAASLGVVALLAGFAFAFSRSAAAPAPDAVAIDRLHVRCVDAMTRSACRAMSGPDIGPATEGVLLVAGVGPVDARAWTELRAAGDAMCTQVVRRCREDWSGPACRTARAMHGEP